MLESIHRDEVLALPPNRTFGLGMGGVFLIIGLLPLWGGGSVRLWAIAVTAVCAVLAFVAPNLYTPLNRAWMQLGLLLGRIVNPIVLAVMFYAVVLPTGLVLRMFRRSSLRQGYDAGAKSYWEPRTPPGPDPKSLERQF